MCKALLAILVLVQNGWSALTDAIGKMFFHPRSIKCSVHWANVWGKNVLLLVMTFVLDMQLTSGSDMTDFSSTDTVGLKYTSHCVMLVHWAAQSCQIAYCVSLSFVVKV